MAFVNKIGSKQQNQIHGNWIRTENSRICILNGKNKRLFVIIWFGSFQKNHFHHFSTIRLIVFVVVGWWNMAVFLNWPPEIFQLTWQWNFMLICLHYVVFCVTEDHSTLPFLTTITADEQRLCAFAFDFMEIEPLAYEWPLIFFLLLWPAKTKWFSFL